MTSEPLAWPWRVFAFVSRAATGWRKDARGAILPARRLSAAPSPVLVLKCTAAIAGLALAVHVAELSGDLAPEASDDRLTTATVVAPPIREVRRIDTSSWQSIARPNAYLAIVSQELDGLVIAHEARRNVAGVREDLLAHGTFAAEAAHLQLVLRLGPVEDLSRPFVIDTVRRAGQLGLAVDRVAQPHALPTKLGLFEVADIVVAANGTHRNCLAFRGAETDQPVAMQGWWCGTAQRPADRLQLTCLIDRIALMPSSEAADLKGYFAAAELRRDARCNPPRLVATGRKSSWLDADAAAVPLRTTSRQGEPARRAASKPSQKAPPKRT